MSLTLSADELFALTGYKRPADQLTELHRQGFYRARRAPVTGDIILERDHYLAVCAGPRQLPGHRQRQPKLRHA